MSDKCWQRVCTEVDELVVKNLELKKARPMNLTADKKEEE